MLVSASTNSIGVAADVVQHVRVAAHHRRPGCALGVVLDDLDSCRSSAARLVAFEGLQHDRRPLGSRGGTGPVPMVLFPGSEKSHRREVGQQEPLRLLRPDDDGVGSVGRDRRDASCCRIIAVGGMKRLTEDVGRELFGEERAVVEANPRSARRSLSPRLPGSHSQSTKARPAGRPSHPVATAASSVRSLRSVAVPARSTPVFGMAAADGEDGRPNRPARRPFRQANAMPAQRSARRRGRSRDLEARSRRKGLHRIGTEGGTRPSGPGSTPTPYTGVPP